MKALHILLLFIPSLAFSQITISNSIHKENSSYPIVSKTDVATILYDTSENILIKKSVDFLAGDIESVSGKRPVVSTGDKTMGKYPIKCMLLQGKTNTMANGEQLLRTTTQTGSGTCFKKTKNLPGPSTSSRMANGIT